MDGGDFAGYAFKYDALKRVSSQYNWYFGYDYTYHNNASGDATTTQIKQVSYNARSGGTGFDNFTLSYTYDDLGSIASVIGSGRTDMNAFYGYDIQGQLTSETSGGLLRTYTYDTYGNIRSATQGGNTVEYKYENPHWLDLLTAYDGEEILYEGQTTTEDTPTSGNPISYYNGTRWEFDWSDGRKLISAESADTELSFEYDQNGIRTSKTVDGVVHDYIYASGKLLRETITEDGNTIVLTFFYDVNGKPYALNYNGTAYYYVLNLQGDVIALIDSVSGATKATYAYDAWGNVIRSTGTIADKNPLRYRSYYYDSETGFYYVSSRYYDPEIGRWINSDDSALLGANSDFASFNLFVYCGNNPVCRTDVSGYFWDTVFDLVSIAADIVEIAANPTSVVAWGALAADAASLILPGLSGGGKVVRLVCSSDEILDVVKHSDDIFDGVKTMRSKKRLGQQLHKTYNPLGDASDEFLDKALKKYGSKLRPDAIDLDNRIIYELKPFNRRSLRKAAKQTKKYAEVLGGEWTIVIDMYIQ